MSRVAVFLLAVLASTAGACAPAAGPPQAVAAEKVGLDHLFARLKETADEREARMLEVAIIHAWSDSGREEVDLMMREGLRALEDMDLPVAEQLFREVTRSAPDFAEGWNMLATVRLLQEDYAEALRALDMTLRLEPRHFGALVLFAGMMEDLGRPEIALKAYDRALAINPHLDDVAEQADVLRTQVAGVWV